MGIFKKRKTIDKPSVAGGAGLATYGTASAVATGLFCPVCFIGAGILFAFGVKNKKDKEIEQKRKEEKNDN